jgi:GntR family transcriptional repressor for pyruvate dehydrogenase complex
MALRPIERGETVHSACDRELRRSIFSGELAPGEKLPAERKLAFMLGVSRLTLRAVLATLVRDGLIEVQHGIGYFVRDYRRTGELPGFVTMAAGNDGFADVVKELLRVRRHLAVAVLEALVERPPTKKLVQSITEAVNIFDELIEARDATLEDFAVSDMVVVEALVEATESPVLRLCFNPILAVVSSQPALRKAMFHEPKKNVAGWRMFLLWLATKPKRSGIGELVEHLEARDAVTVELLRKKKGSW